MSSLLPAQYAWLAKEPGPKMLLHLLSNYGLREGDGAANNPRILEMAKRCGLAGVYKHDSIAWCGLAMLDAALAAGKPLPFTNAEALWALNWKKFGTPIERPMLGDILVKPRKDNAGKVIGGHVCMYVGEDPDFYHCLGGNQDDSLAIRRIRGAANWTARRPPYNNVPANVRIIRLSPSGAVGGSEA